MVTFNNPLVLALTLVTIPLFLMMGFLLNRQQKKVLGKFGSPSVLRRFSGLNTKKFSVFIFSLSLLALSIAAAEPWKAGGENKAARTLNAVIVLDVSRSMNTIDGIGGQSRLKTGVLALEKLLDTYPDGKFGLIMYTDRVAVYTPTYDHVALKMLMENVIENYSVKGEGSNTNRALKEASAIIALTPSEVDTVFLITDGGTSFRDNTSYVKIYTVLDSLSHQNINLVVAGVGGLVPAPIPVYDLEKTIVGYHEYNGSTVYTALDEMPLKKMAQVVGGEYVHLENERGLVRISKAKNLDNQPISEENVENLVWLPVGISILLMSLWLFLSWLKK